MSYTVVKCASLLTLFSVQWIQFSGIAGMPEKFAIVGLKAALPCNISDQFADDTVTLVLWYKGEIKSPIYTLDARRGSLESARHFPGNEIGTRARFDVSSVPSLLYIEPLHAEDDGVYRCRIEFKRSRTYTEFTRLNVVVPAREVTIMSASGTRLRDVIGPYNEGERVMLLCEAEGIPSPSVTWWRDTTLIDDTYFQTHEGYIRNELSIHKLERNDLMVSFSCNATNSNLTGPAIATIMIDVNLKPLDVRIVSPKIVLVSNQKLRIECQAWGARPKAFISWWLDDVKVQFGKEIVLQNLTTSTLHLDPTPDDNGKTLSCRGYNPLVSDKILEDNWKLEVEYPPEMVLSLGTSIQANSIKEGNDVFLECHIASNPQVSLVRWFFEGKQLLSDVSKGLIISNRTLVLQKVKRTNRGRYKCSAFNRVGENSSNELFLAIKYAPVCLRPRNSVYGVSNYEALNATCEVIADPPAVSFHWSLNNTLECIDVQTNDIVNGTTSTISYTPGIMFGYGALLCWAANVIGKQKEPCVMKIVPAGPPESLIGCKIVNQSSTSLHVICRPGFDGGLKQKFHLEIYTSSMEILLRNISSAETPVFSVEHLEPETSLVLAIYASNNKGKSSPVVLMAKTYSQLEQKGTNLKANFPDGSTQTSGFSPKLAALIGVISLLICTALVITIISMRRKSQQPPEKGSLSDEVSSKYDIPLKKDLLTISDSTVESPDIIPCNPDSQICMTDKDISRYDDDSSYGFPKTRELSSEYITAEL